MSDIERIDVPELTLEKPGMRLEYDGWRDRVTGAIRGSHSNQKESRWYRFACCWAQGQVGEIIDFEIAAKHQHPDNWIKGTAAENRKDVKDVARRVSRIWRDEKFKEQEKLRQATQDQAVVRISVQSKLWRGRTCEAWWVGGAVLLEPRQFERISCREGWIEVLPIRNSDQQVAEYIAQIYADNGNDELAVKAAQRGLSLAEIERVMAIGREGDWGDAEKVMNEISSSRQGKR